MTDVDVLESTEIPDYVDDANIESEDEMMEDVSATDEQFALRFLFVHLAERCLSHAHAKEQAPPVNPSADAPDMEDAEKTGSADTEPITLKIKSYPRITAFVVSVLFFFSPPPHVWCVSLLI